MWNRKSIELFKRIIYSVLVVTIRIHQRLARLTRIKKQRNSRRLYRIIKRA